MSRTIRILSEPVLSKIQAYETDRLKKLIPDEFEREMATWNARWREESLRHYLNTGWSVGLWSDDSESQLNGYFLAQPFLFFMGLTQVLWVEQLAADNADDFLYLMDTAIRYSREKHLQSVMIELSSDIDVAQWPFKYKKISENIYEFPTTKR